MVTEPPLSCVPQARLLGRLSKAKTWLHILDFEVDAALQLGMLRGTEASRYLYAIEHLMMRGLDRVSSISGQISAELRRHEVLDRVQIPGRFSPSQHTQLQRRVYLEV